MFNRPSCHANNEYKKLLIFDGHFGDDLTLFLQLYSVRVLVPSGKAGSRRLCEPGCRGLGVFVVFGIMSLHRAAAIPVNGGNWGYLGPGQPDCIQTSWSVFLHEDSGRSVDLGLGFGRICSSTPICL